MSKKTNNENYVISDDVLASIVKMSVDDVEGIAGFVKKPFSLKNIVPAVGDLKYIDISQTVYGTYDIALYIKVKSGYSIPKLCSEMKEKIENTLKKMIEEEITNITINVESVEFCNEPIKSKD